MKHPAFRQILLGIFTAAVCVVAYPGSAQPPEASPTKRAVARSKPQVIYHLPPSSAATLHSQAKGQSNDLPIDGDMPTSLQLSRSNANAAAAKARQEPAIAPPPVQQQPQTRQQRVNRPKAQSVRAAKSPSMKTKGPSHGGPKKSHKK